jgi:uncharacterized membrane protein
VNPALIEHARQRQASIENRIADRITAFSGSMRFVYLHAIWFASWIAFGVESYPYGLLTMIVSLEAIFLSTFVMISQNRADAKREVLAKSTRTRTLVALSRYVRDRGFVHVVNERGKCCSRTAASRGPAPSA